MQSAATYAGQHCDFEQRDSAQGKRFSSPDSAAERAKLISREPLRLDEPAYENVSVKQKVWGQGENPSFLAQNLPKIRGVG